jgi:anti-anti-sigma factor
MKPLREFEVQRQTKGEVQVLRLIGPLDDYTFKQLQTVLNRCRTDEHRKIVMDCDNLDHMSTTAIEALAEFCCQVRRDQGEVILARLPGKVLDMIEVLGHTPDFKFHDNEKDAVKLLDPNFKEEEEKTKFI